jgi:ankyrin repeat protein
LLSELQFLCGLLHCLFCLSLNLQAADESVGDGPFTYPILDKIAEIVKDIGENAATSQDDGFVKMTVDLRFYRNLASRIATFAAYNLQVLHETLLGGPIPTMFLQPTTVKELGPTLTEWVDVLNSEPYNRTMLEWASERGLVQARREFDPGYQNAATKWVEFASADWDSIKEGIERLFAIPATNNFVQWAVEFARSSWPDVYDFGARSARPVVNLVNDILQGKVTPLHYAAMLGLKDIVVKLLDKPQHAKVVNATGFFGSPLYCALVGPRVLRFGCRPSSWGVLIVEMEPADATIINTLIAKGASSDFRFSMPNMDAPIQLLHVAFVAATMLEDAEIFINIIKDADPLQEDFTLMLMSSAIFDEKAEKIPSEMSRLATAAFDQAMFMPGEDLPWEGNVICIAIWNFMFRTNLYFDADEGFKLPFVKDDEFDFIVRQCVIDERATMDDDTPYFQRLAEDRRFNPNLSANEDDDIEGTIVHLAVSGMHHAVLHYLYLGGADFSALDSQGRTPLMVAEVTETLDILVKDYGVSTTAQSIEGRNIWHLAAATNDVKILKWLCKHDPAKSTNINAVNNIGRSPLAEALMCIRTLSSELTSHFAPIPAAAKVLLAEELVDVQLGTEGLPLAALLNQWRDWELVNMLKAAGVDMYV